MGFLLQLVAYGIAGPVMSWLVFRLRSRHGARRESAAAVGGVVAIGAPVRLPGWRHARSGRLLVRGRRVTWRPRWRRGPGLDLTGARVLRIRPSGTEAVQREGNEVAVCHTATGVVEVHAHPTDIRLLRAALEGSGPDTAGVDPVLPVPPRLVPVWSAALVGFAVLYSAFLTAMYAFGREVTARVTSAGDGWCDVTWPDPWSSVARHAGVDCAGGTRTGAPLRVVATPWPLRGGAFDLYDTRLSAAVYLGATAALGLCGVGWRVLRRHRIRWSSAAAPVDGVGGAAAVPFVEPPAPIDPARVDHDSVAAAMLERARFERWEDPDVLRLRPGHTVSRVPPGGSWWRVPALRRPVLRRAGPVAAILAFTLIPTVLAIPTLLATLTLHRAPTATAAATVDGIEDDPLPLFPHHVDVHLHVHGRRVDATVPLLRHVRTGARVTVRYAVHHPSAARVDGDGGPARELLLGAVLGMLSLAVTAGGLGAVVRRSRRSWRALSRPGRPARYVLAPDGDDATLVVLFDGSTAAGDGEVARIVRVSENALGVLPVDGSCTLHGDGQRLARPVTRIGDRVLWPAGRALPVDAEDLAELVDGGFESFSLEWLVDRYGEDVADDAGEDGDGEPDPGGRMAVRS